MSKMHKLSPKKPEKMIIPADYKVARGHQKWDSGCGTHDNRPKRQRTRYAVKRAAISEFDSLISQRDIKESNSPPELSICDGGEQLLRYSRCTSRTGEKSWSVIF
jgi:hypothetical protein